jgi:hypothetical protein
MAGAANAQDVRYAARGQGQGETGGREGGLGHGRDQNEHREFRKCLMNRHGRFWSRAANAQDVMNMDVQMSRTDRM